MATQEFRITYNDIEIDVEGIYYIGRMETREEPSEPSEFDIYHTRVEGVDILALLDDEQLEEISQLVIEIIEE